MRFRRVDAIMDADGAASRVGETGRERLGSMT